MGLDRDELAARLLVALVRSGRSIGAEADAVSLADALLSRLRPSAPDAPASGAPVAAPFRDIWQHDETGRIVELPPGSDSPGPRYRLVATTNAGVKPLAAPSPAATPAAWVPSVGDKVRHTTDTNGEWGIVTRVDASGAPSVAYSKNMTASCPANEWTYIGPATSSERAAAGLPPADAPAFDEASDRGAAVAAWAREDEAVRPRKASSIAGWLARARRAAPASKPVDREGLRAALQTSYDSWMDNHADGRNVIDVHTDAAIAFMAKGGA